MRNALSSAFPVLFVSTVLCLWLLSVFVMPMASANPHVDIDVTTAYTMITNGSFPSLVILDVRTQSEYDSGHLCNSMLIPDTELESRIGELEGHENHEIIVYCRLGGRSHAAANSLDSHNFTNVYDMTGGITAWQDAGYPVCTPSVGGIAIPNTQWKLVAPYVGLLLMTIVLVSAVYAVRQRRQKEARVNNGYSERL